MRDKEQKQRAWDPNTSHVSIKGSRSRRAAERECTVSESEWVCWSVGLWAALCCCCCVRFVLTHGGIKNSQAGAAQRRMHSVLSACLSPPRRSGTWRLQPFRCSWPARAADDLTGVCGHASPLTARTPRMHLLLGAAMEAAAAAGGAAADDTPHRRTTAAPSPTWVAPLTFYCLHRRKRALKFSLRGERWLKNARGSCFWDDLFFYVTLCHSVTQNSWKDCGANVLLWKHSADPSSYIVFFEKRWLACMVFASRGDVNVIWFCAIWTRARLTGTVISPLFFALMWWLQSRVVSGIHKFLIAHLRMQEIFWNIFDHLIPPIYLKTNTLTSYWKQLLVNKNTYEILANSHW